MRPPDYQPVEEDSTVFDVVEPTDTHALGGGLNRDLNAAMNIMFKLLWRLQELRGISTVNFEHQQSSRAPDSPKTFGNKTHQIRLGEGCRPATRLSLGFVKKTQTSFPWRGEGTDETVWANMASNLLK
jgi:hypothetical protein